MSSVVELSSELDALESLLAAKRTEREDAALIDLNAEVERRAALLAQARVDAKHARADTVKALDEKDAFIQESLAKQQNYAHSCMRAAAIQGSVAEADRLWREARQKVIDARERLQKLDQ